jgi:hypothetical protein
MMRKIKLRTESVKPLLVGCDFALYTEVSLGSLLMWGRNSLYFRLLNAAFTGHMATQYRQPNRRQGNNSCSHQCKHNLNSEE